MIECVCPNCRQAIGVPETSVGQVEHCPTCEKPFRVEGLAPGVPLPAGTPAKGRRTLGFTVGAVGFLVVLVFGLGYLMHKSASDYAAGSGGERARDPIPDGRALPRETVPEAGRKALERIARIEAKTEVGLVLAEYRKELGESWADIKPFVEGSEGRSCPAFSARLSLAVDHYQRAAKLWSEKITAGHTATNWREAAMQAEWAFATIHLLKARAIAEGQTYADEAKIADAQGVVDRYLKTSGAIGQ